MSTPPGWYDVGDGIERRYDGEAWTEERRPLATAQGPAGLAATPAVDALPEEDAAPAGKQETGVLAWVRPRIAPLATLAAVATLVGVGVVVTNYQDSAGPTTAAAPAETRLLQAVNTCNMTRSANGVTLGDGDTSVVLDGRGQEDVNGISTESQACVLAQLGTPDSTLNLMGTTRALDGRQQAEWDAYSATWSYHPDSGLNITIVEG